MKATVFTDSDGRTREINGSLSEIMNKIWKLVNSERHSQDDDVLVKVGKFTFWWNSAIAHYCFAKGRLNEKEAFKLMNRLA